MLKNKLGIQSEVELARVGERLSKLQAKRLFESGVLDSLEAGSFESLRVIHKELFGEIYEFAGEIRGVISARVGLDLLLSLISKKHFSKSNLCLKGALRRL